MYYTIWLTMFSGSYHILEVGNEVQRRLGVWKSKLSEIEQQCIELQVTNSEPNRGKKKSKLKGDLECSDLADYTAELVFHFFLRYNN